MTETPPEAIADAWQAAYERGHEDGWNEGYEVGFEDGGKGMTIVNAPGVSASGATNYTTFPVSISNSISNTNPPPKGFGTKIP